MKNKDENEIINDYLNPVLGEFMDNSLSSILEMKESGLITKEDKETIDFILIFIEDSLVYYSTQKNTKNCAILSDLKQYLLDLTI